jgi:hypothetical protein
LAGGFKTKQPELSPTAQGLLDRDKGRVTIEDRPDLFYIQNMPGVKYDEKGNIIGSQPWSPSVSMDEIRVPANQGGIGSLAPSMYTPDAGSMGSGRSIPQQYNNSSMYNSVMRPTPMPQVRFPGMNASMPYDGGMGPITTMPFVPDTFPRFAEGGEVEDPEYMMQGGIPHLSMGGFLRRAGRAVQQGMRPITEIRDRREQQQIAAQQFAAQQASAAQRAAAEQAAAQATAEQAQQRVLADRQARAAQFAQGMQFNPGMGQAPGGMGMNRTFADGGIAGLAKGGYPRRTGQISGPGTEKSDSIPAMLSDGEFVMTAKAVRGAGKGSRRAGAKKMYELMHQLERKASRG